MCVWACVCLFIRVCIRSVVYARLYDYSSMCAYVYIHSSVCICFFMYVCVLFFSLFLFSFPLSVHSCVCVWNLNQCKVEGVCLFFLYVKDVVLHRKGLFYLSAKEKNLFSKITSWCEHLFRKIYIWMLSKKQKRKTTFQAKEKTWKSKMKSKANNNNNNNAPWKKNRSGSLQENI